MHPQWSARLWEMYVSQESTGFPHVPDWVRIAFLRYWTTTNKWYGY